MDGNNQSHSQETNGQEDKSQQAESDANSFGQFKNIESLAQSLLQSTKKTNNVQNLTGSVQKLFPKNFQNLTGSTFFEHSDPPSPENNRGRSFASGSNRCSQNDQHDVFQTKYSPATISDREFKYRRYEPYQFRGSRYSPLPGQCNDSPSSSQQFRYQEISDDKPQISEKTLPEKKREKKEKKSITTKTFAHGMMDVSLLTSNATQLRAVLSNPEYEFYTLLLWLIGLSIVLQILSAVLLIMSDFFKTQVKEKDRQNQRKRKLLSFLSLILVTVVMSLNVLISAFSTPYAQQTPPQKVTVDVPKFSSQGILGARSEL